MRFRKSNMSHCTSIRWLLQLGEVQVSRRSKKSCHGLRHAPRLMKPPRASLRQDCPSMKLLKAAYCEACDAAFPDRLIWLGAAGTNTRSFPPTPSPFASLLTVQV